MVGVLHLSLSLSACYNRDMKHNKGVIEPINQAASEQTDLKPTPDRSQLADLYPKASERDGYLKEASKESDYQPVFLPKILAGCALFLPLPYMLLILGVDYFVRTTTKGNIFLHLPIIVLGLLFSVAFIYFSTKYVTKKLLFLRFNESAYLILYLLCMAPLAGALFGIAQTLNYAALILSAGLFCISLLLFLTIGFILSKPETKDGAKSISLIFMIAVCFIIEFVYLTFELLTS